MKETPSYSLDAILEDAKLGGEPSSEYMERLQLLDELVRECMFISRSYKGVVSDNKRILYASMLFTSLLTRGVSLLNLAPFSKWAQKLIEHWDYASASGVVRTMLELRLCFYYLCIDPCPENEWECRLAILDLHNCVTHRRLIEAREISDSEAISSIEIEIERIRKIIKSNSFFLTLASKKQEHLLRGRDAYLISMEELAEKSGLDKKNFRWIYILFSNHVHGLPMSFYRTKEDSLASSRGLPDSGDERDTSLCLSFALTLLVKTRDEILKLFEAIPKNSDDLLGSVFISEVAEELKDTGAFPVGSIIDLIDNDLIKVKATRLSIESMDLSYYAPGTDHLVLKQIETEGKGTFLEVFDTFFWSIRVNGGAATSVMMEKIETKDWAFKVDIETRTLLIKVDL